MELARLEHENMIELFALAAMTARVAADGVAAGCDVAILQASDMGRPVYERMGYRRVVQYMGYVEPESSAQPPD